MLIICCRFGEEVRRFQNQEDIGQYQISTVGEYQLESVRLDTKGELMFGLLIERVSDGGSKARVSKRYILYFKYAYEETQGGLELGWRRSKD